MARTDPLIERLNRLLQRGALPMSAFSTAMTERLQSLIAVGAIREQRAGAGIHWKVENREAVERFLARLMKSTHNNGVRTPIVFLLYNYDSEQQREAILQLVQRLRSEGVDARLDCFVMSPPEGWAAWTQQQIKQADFVLIVLSKRSCRILDQASDSASEAIWSGVPIRQLLYRDDDDTDRFIPIFLQDAALSNFVRAASAYRMPADYDALYARIAQQPGLEPLRPLAMLPLASSGAAASEDATPACDDEPSAELTTKLKNLTARREEWIIAGRETVALDKQILSVRRRLRDGAQLQIGDQIGKERFLLIKGIGRGNFATVWKARDRRLQRTVAVKVLHPYHVEDRTRRERFARGARIMALLDHPTIVRSFLEVQQDERFHFYVMEYIEGENLHEAVVARKLSPSDALQAIVQISAGLQLAHERGIVHRDVAPKNILLDLVGRPRLTDFDLVHAEDTTGGTGADPMGTFVFAAPETLDSPDTVDGRADIFSLGMTLLFALHGAVLPRGAFMNPQRFFPVGTPKNLIDIVLKAVEPERDYRYPSAAEFASALEAYLVSTPAGLTGMSLTSRPNSDITGPATDQALDMAAYENILNIIQHMSLVIERNPATFSRIDEECLRDHFLLPINREYLGAATSETRNMKGKTDILVRDKGRDVNFFIAECKFWTGPSEFPKAIDQLLSYLTWRDTKAAIILFVRNSDFSAVLLKIPECLAKHPRFLRSMWIKGETLVRGVFQHPKDLCREIIVTVTSFHVPD